MTASQANLFDGSLRINRIIDETPETKSLLLDMPEPRLQFQPGQFVNVTMTAAGRRVRRAYSIASSPLDPEIMLTVKRMEEGLVSTYLCDAVKPGDVLHIRGPYGLFTLDEAASHLVFVAGGSGIAPFRSMWRYLLQIGSTAQVDVLYASRSPAYVIYRSELDVLNHAGCRVTYTFTRNDDPLWTGYARRIDRSMLVDVAGNLTDKSFYVCGPPALCDCVMTCLTALGVERRRIKAEKYD